jgi:excinuclease ABC subunit A
MAARNIVIRGARQNNLKNVDLEIRQNALTVLTGPSGSGKSSLAFDTLFSEGQRRFVESQSTYVRQFLNRLDKPDVDAIEGLCPTLAVQSRNAARTARSTVGTVTEIYDYLRLLFAKTGDLHCPDCGMPVRALSVDEMVDRALERFGGGRAFVLSPLEISPKLGPDVLRDLVRAHGFSYILSGGVLIDLETCPEDELEAAIARARKKAHEGGNGASRLHIVVDRTTVSAARRARLADSIETALRQGGAYCAVRGEDGEQLLFSPRAECLDCARPVPPPTPHELSFNNPLGACPECKGFGDVYEIDMDLVIPDPGLSLRQGAIACWRGAKIQRYVRRMHARGEQELGVRLDVPYRDLSDEEKQRVYFGHGHLYGIKDFFDEITRKSYKASNRFMLGRYRSLRPCPECGGTRLNRRARSVKINGLDIAQAGAMPLSELLEFARALTLPAHLADIVKIPMREILSRTQYLVDIGLGYLTLWRLSRTLSGGEMQRIHLAAALGSRLTGTLTILDEPTVGLHPRDTERLIRVLHDIRDTGNTVLVVEHDMQVMRAADRIIDMGPGPGQAGGEAVFSGTLKACVTKSQSLTAQYLRGERSVGGRAPRPGEPREWITIRGARQNNLQSVDAAFPVNRLSCVTGVSGSGKSSLIIDVLYPYVARRTGAATDIRPGDCDTVDNWRVFHSVEMVGQDPIGRTPRANPASFMDILAPIRALFAATPEAKARRIAPGLFSFNSPMGRCEECEGAGFIKIEMQFLADIFVQCEACGGTRYKPEALSIAFRGKTIAEVLALTGAEAASFFFDQPGVLNRLQPLLDVGLGYLRLGQPLNTLSAGEAQRLKIASELGSRARGHILFLFDEPTMGLHPGEVQTFLECADRLLDKGHTVIVIEHNLDVIANADYILDLGPEGGRDGGRIVASGTPAQIAAARKSWTGKFLKQYLMSNGNSKTNGIADGAAPKKRVKR